MQTVPLLPGRWLIGTILVSAAIVALLLFSARLHVQMSWLTVGLLGLAPVAAAICFAFRGRATPAECVVRDLVESVSIFVAISLLGALASYPLAAGRHGFVDAGLERIDLGLGFHWISLYRIVASHPWLQLIERAAYLSIFVTPMLLLGYFAAMGKRAESRLFLATFWIAAVLTLAIFPLIPAAGPFATLWHGAMPYMPLSALYQDQVILALRHHAIDVVDIGQLHGLVCAPSFHAACAVLYISSVWRIDRLRWPVTLLNIAMLLATPVEGTHYLADLLFGGLVALSAIGVTPNLIALIHRPESIGRAESGPLLSPIAAN